jgi:uncharacterized membrane protein
MRERVPWGWEERLLVVAFGFVAYAVVTAPYAFVVGSSIAGESAAAALVAFLLLIRVVSAFGRPDEGDVRRIDRVVKRFRRQLRRL